MPWRDLMTRADDVDHQREHVHRAHVDQRVVVVDAVRGVGQPLVQAVPDEPDGDHAGRRDDRHARDLKPRGRGSGPQVRLAPRQDHHGDRGEQVRDRDDERRVERVGVERRVVRVQRGQPDGRQQHQHQRPHRHPALLRHLGRAVRQDPVERRGEDHPGRRQEQRPHPGEEPQAHQQDQDHLEHLVVHQPAGQQHRVGEDRQRVGRGGAERVVDPERVHVLVEVEPERTWRTARAGRPTAAPWSTGRRTCRRRPA